MDADFLADLEDLSDAEEESNEDNEAADDDGLEKVCISICCLLLSCCPAVLTLFVKTGFLLARASTVSVDLRTSGVSARAAAHLCSNQHWYQRTSVLTHVHRSCLTGLSSSSLLAAAIQQLHGYGS